MHWLTRGAVAVLLILAVMLPHESMAQRAAGDGLFDGDPIVFEYTMDTPGGSEAIYRCTGGSRQQCSATQDGCTAGGESKYGFYAS